MIIRNTGVFLGSVTQTDGPGSTRGAAPGASTAGSITRTYTMPIIVEDPAVETIVTSGNAMYGPWLEGTGSRNATTRFKGYHGYRLASQVTRRVKRRAIADTALQPFIERCS